MGVKLAPVVYTCICRIPRRRPPGRRANTVGTWLSLVERTLGVGEVASSNLVVPTIIFIHLASQKGSLEIYEGPYAFSALAAEYGTICREQRS
jgi:hypothetical protein